MPLLTFKQSNQVILIGLQNSQWTVVSEVDSKLWLFLLNFDLGAHRAVAGRADAQLEWILGAGALESPDCVAHLVQGSLQLRVQRLQFLFLIKPFILVKKKLTLICSTMFSRRRTLERVASNSS
jgi:hypothetical protein